MSSSNSIIKSIENNSVKKIKTYQALNQLRLETSQLSSLLTNNNNKNKELQIPEEKSTFPIDYQWSENVSGETWLKPIELFSISWNQFNINISRIINWDFIDNFGIKEEK